MIAVQWGVNYRQLGDDSRAGYIVRLPCVVSSPLTKEPASCDKLDPFTEVELLEQEKEMNLKMMAITQAVPLIRKTKLQSGIVECPSCKNELHFSVAKSNGHIWAKCKTDKCLSWIE